jgi:hypothetical protein
MPEQNASMLSITETWRFLVKGASRVVIQTNDCIFFVSVEQPPQPTLLAAKFVGDCNHGQPAHPCGSHEEAGLPHHGHVSAEGRR